MKEWKIGEIRQIDNEWYQCLESSSCRCDYGELGDCHKIACASGERSDDKEVYFKKLKKVGLPYYNSDNKLCQEYKCYIVPLITDDIVYVLADNRVVIEVKQNKKEDMEEKKSNLKPFDIQKAREGKPVYTRDGRKARIICFDAKGTFPIIALVDENAEEYAFSYTEDGKFSSETAISNKDLMMLPEKKKGWVNIYEDMRIYASEEGAKMGISPERTYITTTKIEWEE